MACIRWLDTWGEEVVVSFFLGLLVLLLGVEVFSRFLLGKSFTWIEEVCRYLFVWGTYIGVAVAVKRKEQLRILMFMDILKKYSPKAASICFVISELIFAGFCAAVFYYSLNLIDNMSRFKQVSAALEIDVKYAYMIIPISMGLTVFRTLQGLYRDFKNGTLRYEARED